MEKRNQSINQDWENAELFGNDMKINPNPDSIRMPFLTAFKHNLDMMIINAKDDKDLDAIGLKLNEAIDNHYNIDVLGYQFKAARKMTQIENKPKYTIN
jgi:hypothetical protein